MAGEKPLALQLSEFACRLTYEQIPDQLIQKAKVYFLDWLGSALAGGSEPPTRMVMDFASSYGGKPESTLLPSGDKNACLMAALVNGVSSHVVEMDDLHRESVFHPAASILPAVFALAEKEHASGRELILAIVVGYEVGIRVAIAAGKSHYRYWHTTGTCGTFGAAAATGKMMRLDAEAIAWALGSAGTQAAGLWEFLVEGAMSKQLHSGKAAFNGLLSSILARQGFTGAKKIFEGDKGFFRATSTDFEEGRLLAKLGEEFVSERNSLKYYASCGHTHSAIDATLKAIGTSLVDPGSIESVRVATYQAALDLLRNVEPKTPYAAKFNIPFCVATAIKHRHVGRADFAESRLEDPQLHDLMKRVSLESDPVLSSEYPRKWATRVEILLRDGTRLTGFNDYPKGDPENPLTEQESITKFKELSKDVISEEKSHDIAQAVLSLEAMEDIARLELHESK